MPGFFFFAVLVCSSYNYLIQKYKIMIDNMLATVQSKQFDQVWDAGKVKWIKTI